LTEIAQTTKVPDDYDLVIIGTPIWAWKPTPAIRTYISQNNLAGKKVALFYTFETGMKQVAEETKALIPNTTVTSELS